MKTALPVDRGMFETAIATAESNGPLENRSMLWGKITDLYNAMTGIPTPITPAIALGRVDMWALNIKTPVGKKGRKAGSVVKPKAPKPDEPDAEPKADVFYIWVDKDGKELRRAVKGKGRTRTGAEERPDGNWYIVENLVSDEPVVKPEPAPAPDPTAEDISKGKVYRDVAKVSLAAFLKDLHPLNVKRNGELIIVESPYVQMQEGKQPGGTYCGLMNIRCNAAYYKFVINKNTKTIAVWIAGAAPVPDYVIEGALGNMTEDKEQPPEA